jgi:hypothetical protein
VFAAPAKTSSADGKALALFLAELFKEASYTGIRLTWGAADEEGHGHEQGPDDGNPGRCQLGKDLDGCALAPVDLQTRKDVAGAEDGLHVEQH